MLKRFIPDIYQESIFTINYKKLKKNGIKCLLFDLDNTISPAKEVVFCEKTKKLFDKLKNDFKIILFSNNFPKRVSKFGNYYDLEIACISLKPFSFKYRYILKKHKLNKNEVACIGDQLLTDINGGNIRDITPDSNLCVKWWLARGWDENYAKQKISDIQIKNSLKI